MCGHGQHIVRIARERLKQKKDIKIRRKEKSKLEKRKKGLKAERTFFDLGELKRPKNKKECKTITGESYFLL